MTYVVPGLLIAAFSLFFWLTIKAVRTRVVVGIGWSVAQAEQPILYRLCVAALLLNLSAALGFLLIVVFAPALSN